MTWQEAVGRAAGAMLGLIVVGVASGALVFWAVELNGGLAGAAIFLAGVLVFYIGSFAIGIKVFADAVSDKVVQRLQSQVDDIGRAPRQAASSHARAGESANVRDAVVGVKFDPNAAGNVIFTPNPPFEFSASEDGQLSMEITCGEEVAWEISFAGGNAAGFAIRPNSGVGDGAARVLRAAPGADDSRRALDRTFFLKIEFDNGEKFNRVAQFGVTP